MSSVESLFFFLVLKIFVHWVGEKTARHPKMQMMLKIEPIRGFLQGMFSVVVGGKKVSITIRSNPNSAMNIRYVMSDLRICLGDIAYHLLRTSF